MDKKKGKDIFVAMPFRHEYDDVFLAIQKASSIAGLRTRRVDQEHFTGSIVSHIFAAIEASEFMVAVVSEENGNVYYEIGLAHCQKKPVVLLTTDTRALRFDLAQHRAVVYDPKNPFALVEELAKALVTLSDTSVDATSRLEQSLAPAESASANRKNIIDRARTTLVQEATLQEPAKVTMYESVPNTTDIAIEVTDFLGVRIRAIVDVNGIVRGMRRYEG